MECLVSVQCTISHSSHIPDLLPRNSCSSDFTGAHCDRYFGAMNAGVRECISLALSQGDKWIGRECSGDEKTEREIMKGKFPAALGKTISWYWNDDLQQHCRAWKFYRIKCTFTEGNAV